MTTIEDKKHISLRILKQGLGFVPYDRLPIVMRLASQRLGTTIRMISVCKLSIRRICRRTLPSKLQAVCCAHGEAAVPSIVYDKQSVFEILFVHELRHVEIDTVFGFTRS